MDALLVGRDETPGGIHHAKMETLLVDKSRDVRRYIIIRYESYSFVERRHQEVYIMRRWKRYSLIRVETLEDTPY
jgi:hypothetical protein